MTDKYLEAMGQETGLRFNESSASLYGTYGGYHVEIGAGVTGRASARVEILFSVNKDGAAPDREAFKPLVKDSKAIAGCDCAGFGLVVSVKNSAWTRKKTVENARTALEEVTGFLRQNGYTDCCQRCGQTLPTATYMVNGGYEHLCADCFQTASAGAAQKREQEEQKKENVAGGIVGAVLGSLAGVVVMVLLDQLGYVAALSGLVLAVCALKGYELLGGKLGNLGTVLCIVIMIAMVYVGNQITWAIAFYNELKDYMEVTFFDCFRSVADLLDLVGDEAKSAYFTGLAQQYLFVALGAIPTIITSRKNQRLRNSVRSVGGPEV